MPEVILGLSDGVDSAVSAYILEKRGFTVRGLYMDIAGEQGREAALRSAAQTGIPLKVLDVRSALDTHVCAPFVSEYLRGRTPNPCILCNPAVKIKALEDYARETGAQYIATGHYIKTDGHSLFMGAPDNDQSYMFQRLTQSQVDHLLLPLGEKNKAQVRKLAEKLGLSCAKKPDSRDNCFVKGMNCAEWIERQSPESVPRPGNALLDGRIIGRHEGIHHWTVGQRWPEDTDGRRLYVSGIDADNAEIHLSFWEELFTDSVSVSGLHFINGEAPADEFEGYIRVRHTRRETPRCRVKITGDCASIVTETRMRAPAAGQPAALYIGQKLIGGGFVENVRNR